MRFLRRILFSTGPRLGLAVGMLGVLLVGFLAIAPYRQAEDYAVGYLIAFVGFSWAAITGYLGRDWSLKLEMTSFIGCGFVLGCVASFISEDATVIESCVAWGGAYVVSLVIAAVVGLGRQ